jgi:putative salt-induced outer membrane protein YdiY
MRWMQRPVSNQRSELIVNNRIFLSSVLILGVLLTSAPALAIVNVLPSGNLKDGFAGKFATSVTWRTGNTNLLQWSGSANASYHHDDHGLLFKAQVTYGSKSEEVYIARTFEHIRYRYTLTDWLTTEALFQHQYDMFKALKFRALLGWGLATNWKPFENLSMVLGSTYLLEREIEGTDVPITLSSFADFDHRWSNYVQLGWNITETIGLSSTNFLQPRLDDFSDLRIYSENSLTVKANDIFSVKVSFNATYDSKPYSDVDTVIESLDTNLKTSLEFSF